jgi:hypothetical protein
MPIELTCACGKRLQVSHEFAGKVGECPACGRSLRIPERDAAAAPVSPPAPEAVQAVSASPGPKGLGAPEGAGITPAELLAGLRGAERGGPKVDDGAKLTAAGCVLTFLTVVVIFGVALPVVHWRDPATGQALPQLVAITVPFLIGAAFHGICTVLLRLVGLRVWSRPAGGDSALPPLPKDRHGQREQPEP